MSGQTFLVDDDNTLLEMHETGYDSEALLQGLLERYPAILAGDQVNPAEPRHWLLVACEVGVPGEEEGTDRWSLDHLFLDQDGIPTLLRSSAVVIPGSGARLSGSFLTMQPTQAPTGQQTG